MRHDLLCMRVYTASCAACSPFVHLNNKMQSEEGQPQRIIEAFEYLAVQVNLSSTQQVAALGALVCILQKHALLAPPSAVEGGDGPLCVIENISEVRGGLLSRLPFSGFHRW